MLKVVPEENESKQHAPAAVGGPLLDEIVRDGARQMLAAALQAEVAAYIEQHADDVDENGHRLVVRNGYHDERQVATAAGAVRVRQPRVNDRRIDEATGERKRFASAILPAWARKSPQIAEVLPLLYLHGLSSGDFIPALEQFLGASHGLSSATVTRLTEQWRDDAKRFGQRSLTDVDYVYAKAFADVYGAKWPKVAAKITEDLDVLLAFYDYPAEHWIHLRTTNPIESTFATVRLRQRVTKGPGSRAAGVAMAFKLLQSAERRWRAVNAPHLVALVRAGARFDKGIPVERPDDHESRCDRQVA